MLKEINKKRDVTQLYIKLLTKDKKEKAKNPKIYFINTTGKNTLATNNIISSLDNNRSSIFVNPEQNAQYSNNTRSFTVGDMQTFSSPDKYVFMPKHVVRKTMYTISIANLFNAVRYIATKQTSQAGGAKSFQTALLELIPCMHKTNGFFTSPFKN